MQSDDNQPRQDDESSQVEHANGLYLCVVIYYVAYTMLYVLLEYLCFIHFIKQTPLQL